MAASSHFLSLTPQTLTRPGSAAAAAIASSTLFTPCSLKPLPKLALALSSIKKYTHYPTSRFVRRVSVSSDLEEDFEGGDGEEEVNGGFPGSESEVPSYSPDLKLFVGNLPFNVDSAALAELFGQAGGVEMVEVIYDKTTGRSRGFGFVTMSSVEEVEAAAQQFNGYELEGRALRVNSGPPPPKREFSSFRGSRGRERSGSNDTNMLFVGNLAWEVDNQALGTLFSECGEVSEARVVYDRDSGRSRGFGFVTYSSPEEASNAVERLDGTDLDGRTIRVSPAESRSTRQY